MKLERKKDLVARTLDLGKDRIVFNTEMLSEIKEAITKQDIKDLMAEGAILIKEVKGRKTKVQRKTRRRTGSIKKSVKGGKAEYVKITRKLRSYAKKLKTAGKVSPEIHTDLRKKIRARHFRSLSHMKEHTRAIK